MQQLRVFLFLFFVFIVPVSAQVFWTEDFGTLNCTGQLTLANNQLTSVGTWVVTATGTNDAEANVWYISSTEAGMGAGNCSSSCLSTSTLNNQTLHIGNVAASPSAFIF